MSYNSAIYHKQDGKRLIVGDTGQLSVESGGEIDIESGGNLTCPGTITIESGGTLNVDSGATFSLDSGSAFALPVQTLTTTETGTALIFGINNVTASTTSPAYTLPTPVAGKWLVVGFTATPTSGAGDAAVINCDTTGVSLTSSGDNTLTLGTTAQTAALYGVSATKWMLIGGSPLSPGTGTQST